jgi:gas vesicle protein
MGHDREGRVSGFISGLLLGAVIGAGVALLAAPDSGRRTRRRIGRAASEVRGTAGNRWDELTEDVKQKVDVAMKGARRKITR